MSSPCPILVCGNGGAVGRDLLRRRDVTLHWALSEEEASAVAKLVRPKACLAREYMAEAVLAKLTRRPAVPTVVLLEPDGWDRRHQYMEGGATALVQANAGERILEAVSVLTGLDFARCPRIDFETVVEVHVDGEDRLLETANLSASGVCIRGFPKVHVGYGTSVGFIMLDDPFEAPAIVVRCFKLGGVDAAGLAFSEPTPHVLRKIDTLVSMELNRMPGADSVMMDGDDVQTLSGLPAVSEHVRDALRARLAAGQPGDANGDWLSGVTCELTPMERAAALGEPSHKWVHSVLDLRLSLYRTRSVVQGNLPNALVQKSLGACRALADKSAGASPEILVQVTQIRAAILRALYSGSDGRRVGRSTDDVQLTAATSASAA